VAIAITATVTVLSGGGFDARSRSMFIALAGVCLVVAIGIDGRAAIRAAGSPLALTLMALAALSLASTLWSVASGSAALRWGLVIGGYAAVFIATATLVETTGPWPVAAGVAILAFVEAVIGLRAVAFHALPDAERLAGAWRPGGTFEYPPALALLEVGALPIFSYALDRCRAPVAGCAAGAAMLAGAVLGLAGSRLALALGGALLLGAILLSRRGQYTRMAAMATAAFVAIGALTGPLVLGGAVGPRTPGAGIMGAGEILALAVASGALWLLVRGAKISIGSGRNAAALCLAAIALVVVAAIATGGRGRSASATERHVAERSDVLHGRAHEWWAAVETWLDRPLLGAGADAYYVASLPHQPVARSRFAHSLPLELAAELGVLGLMLGVAIYAFALRTIARAIRDRDPARCLLTPFVAAFLVSNLLDWTWHLAGLGAMWAAASGSLVWQAPATRPSHARAAAPSTATTVGSAKPG
jgi:hypothetical protein